MPRRPLIATSTLYFIDVVLNTVWFGAALICEAIAIAGKKYDVPHCM